MKTHPVLVLKALAIFSLNLLLLQTAFANNVAVSNVVLTGQNATSDFTLVQFDITWDNSWRVNTGPSNWDACWVFVKYSTNSGATWRHGTPPGAGSRSAT